MLTIEEVLRFIVRDLLTGIAAMVVSAVAGDVQVEVRMS